MARPRSSTPPPSLRSAEASAPAGTEAGGDVAAPAAGKGSAARLLEKEFVPEAVTKFEFFGMACSIVGIYLGALWLLDFSHRFLYGATLTLENHDFKTSYVWDHPEPNFTMSMVITEFWSVLTTIPVAGGMLCYLGIRFRVDPPVMAIYVGTFLMYNFALISHCTLWKPIFQLTLTSVMTNCLSAFWLFGFLATDLVHYVPKLELLSCIVCRAKVAVVAVALVALTAVKLPDYIGQNGGVWTLFYVQAPPVWMASLAALSLVLGSPRKELRPAYRMVSFGGAFLSLAMFLSYCECSSGTQSVVAGVPTLHLAIHISEQIGIYMYGLSLAFLQHVNVNARRGAQFTWLFGVVPYFHCEAGSWSAKLGMENS